MSVKITNVSFTAKGYKVSFDNNLVFLLSENTYVEHMIYNGKIMELGEFQKLVNDIKVQDIMSYAYKLINKKQYSKKMLRDKFVLKAFAEEDIAVALNRLENRNLINDTEFAKNRFFYLMNTKKLGPRAIKNDLFSKGINKLVIDSLLDEFDNGSNLDIQFHKAVNKYTKSSIKKAKDKLYIFLLTKGFESSAIKMIIDNYDFSEIINENHNIRQFYDKLKRAKKVGDDNNRALYKKLSNEGYPHFLIKQILEADYEN